MFYRLRMLARLSLAFAGGILIVLLAILTFANSEIGHRTIARLIEPISGGKVYVEGLSGRVPNLLHAQRVEIRDRNGTWLEIDNVDLDWTAIALLRNRLDANTATAERARLLRRPIPAEAGPDFVIDIRRLQIARLEIMQPGSRAPAVLAVRGGDVHYASLRDWAGNLFGDRIDARGAYRLNASFDNGYLSGTADVTEPSGGLFTRLLGLKPLGTIELHARGEGQRDANRTHFTLTAGPLRASAEGNVNFLARTAELEFSAEAPEMNLRDDLAWKSLAARGRLRGSFDNPDVNADVDVRTLTAQDIRAAGLTGRVSGTRGDLAFNTTISGLRLPGSRPDLFARAAIQAKGTLDLRKPAWAFTVSLSHPLLTLQASGTAGDSKHVRATIVVARIAPFAEHSGVPLDGRANLTTVIDQNGDKYRIAVNGTINPMGRSTPLSRLLGANAKLALTATGNRSDVTISEARLQGSGGNARFSGRARDRDIDMDWSVTVDDLSLLSSRLVGNLRAQGQARGPWQAARVEASASADVGTPKIRRQQVTFTLSGVGLPPQSGNFRAQGRFDNAPLLLRGQLARDPAGLKANIEEASWKSVQGRADLTIPDNAPVSGKATLRLARLDDIVSIVEEPIAGSAQADVTFTANDTGATAVIAAQAQDIAYQGAAAHRAETEAQLNWQGEQSSLTLKTHAMGLVFQGSSIRDATIQGRVDGVFENTSLSLAADAQGLAIGELSGNAKVQVNGRIQSMNVQLAWDARDSEGNTGKVSSAGTLDIARNRMLVSMLRAQYRRETATLDQPFTLSFNREIAVDHLLVKLAKGQVAFAGTISPRLAARGTIENASTALLIPFVPELSEDGSLSANADFSGTVADPEGTFTVQGRGLRARRASPLIAPASLNGRGTLHARTLSLNAEMNAGSSLRATLSGDVSLQAKPELDLKLDGQGDLAFLNPFLSARGRKVQGRAVANVSLGGTFDAIRINGQGTLSGGEVQDVETGLRVHDISLAAEGTGQQIRISQLRGVAGNGNISGSGTMDLSQSDIPVNFTVTAQNARPLVSDRFSATMDANLRITGAVKREIVIAGNIDVTRGEITLPEKVPPKVVVLDVRRPQRGEVSTPAEADMSFGSVRYDLTVTTRGGGLSVRGRGVEAEVGGTVGVRGALSMPELTGGFDLRRGTFTVAGQTFMFTSGRVTFDGMSIRNKIDPALDLVAESTTGGITAKIEVTGYASAPRIELSSTPTLPADEILARVLFQQSTTQLSPGQLAQLAEAAVSLTSGGSGFDPLGSLRRQFGLTRLGVGGGGEGTSGTTVEAGKYVFRNVYVAAKQGLEGGTQAEVQVNLTDKLKVIGTLNSGASTTVTQGAKQQETGSSVGLSYQFEY